MRCRCSLERRGTKVTAKNEEHRARCEGGLISRGIDDAAAGDGRRLAKAVRRRRKGKNQSTNCKSGSHNRHLRETAAKSVIFSRGVLLSTLIGPKINDERMDDLFASTYEELRRMVLTVKGRDLTARAMRQVLIEAACKRHTLKRADI